MKLQKRHVFLMILFISIVIFAYIIVVSFSYNSLNFAPFYKSKTTSDTLEEHKIIYTLNNENEIVFVVNENKSFTLYKMYDNDVSLDDIVRFELENYNNYSFVNSDDFHFLFYNYLNGVVIINEQEETYQIYDNLPSGKKFINHKTNDIYMFNDNSFCKLNFGDIITVQEVYHLKTNINDIKTVEFFDDSKAVISTYNGYLYVVDLQSGKEEKLSNIYKQYAISNNQLYYTFLTRDNKIGISMYNNKEIIFYIDKIDYLSIKVRSDYLYLISHDEIHKVSITRQKKHESLQVSNYIDMTYSLNSILIANDQLMYIPMIKEEMENNNLKKYYGYYLYRYKKV